MRCSGDAVRGPPSKAKSVLEFKDSIAKAQAKGKAHLVKRAYQLTHEDVADVMGRYVATQLSLALEVTKDCNKNNIAKSPEIDWISFQTTLMVVGAFGSGCRGAELCSLRISDLHFTIDGTDTVFGAVLYGVKSKKGKETVKRVIFGNWKDTAVINPALAILIQLAVVHGGDNLSRKAIEGPL